MKALDIPAGISVSTIQMLCRTIQLLINLDDCILLLGSLTDPKSPLSKALSLKTTSMDDTPTAVTFLLCCLYIIADLMSILTLLRQKCELKDNHRLVFLYYYHYYYFHLRM